MARSQANMDVKTNIDQLNFVDKQGETISIISSAKKKPPT
jgi:hypothetical protein